MAVLKITSENFEQEVLKAAQPVVIDFWASWCGPCKMFSPIVDEFAEENEGKVKVGKVNIDDEPDLASRFGVMSIPTAILFKNGQAVQSMVGVQPKAKLEESMGIWLRVFKFPSVDRGTYDRLECTAKHQIYPILGGKVVGDITSADIKALPNH